MSEASSSRQTLTSYLTAPFSYCFQNAAAAESSDEDRQGLLRDEYDDADAISLLSNIHERSRRRSRRRDSRIPALMACGLFGRSKGQINPPQPQARRSRHDRTLSDSSNDSNNLVGARRGDEDAGVLDDRAIADISVSAAPDGDDQDDDDDQAAAKAAQEQAQAQERERAEAEEKAKAEAEAKAKAEAEAQAEAERRRERQLEAARLKREAEEEADRQKEQEAHLAAEEEAAIAKARRKAARKAAKAGLLQVKNEGQGAQRWRTEAEAEAAAGGFDFAPDPEDETAQHAMYYDDHEHQQHEQQPYHVESEYGYDQAGNDPNAYDGDYVVEEHQNGVVHHHHYYHAPPAPANKYGINPELLSPLSPHEFSQQASPLGEEEHVENDKDDRSEDEADIAGLSFGKKGRRKDGGGGGSGSGSGRARRGVPGSSSSGGSGSGSRSYVPAAPSSTGSSSKPSYRDRPRRHERQNSRSSNSSGGLYARGPSPGGQPVTSTSPTLPNLYEQGVKDGADGHAALYAQDTVFGRGKKRSYRDKTSTSGSNNGLLNTPRNPTFEGVHGL